MAPFYSWNGASPTDWSVAPSAVRYANLRSTSFGCSLDFTRGRQQMSWGSAALASHAGRPETFETLLLLNNVS